MGGVIAGLAFCAAYAGLEAVLITWLRLPSFVVTLAGYLGGLGLLLAIIDLAAPGSGGTIRLSNNVLNAIEGGSLSPCGELDRDDRGGGGRRDVHDRCAMPAAECTSSRRRPHP